MILLIGGTSETAPLASGIAGAGCGVLVSTATDAPLAIGDHPRISRRMGPLDEEGLVKLGKKEGFQAIVDAAHPYAAALHAAAQAAAKRLGIPYLSLRRPEGLSTPAPAASEAGWLFFAADHEEAATLAFADGRPVLLTTGSRNLAPYAAQSRRTGIPLAVRILDAPESLAACRAAGIAAERITAGRGPFTIEENLAAIRRFGIGVVVTKESGRAGGLDAKLAAAREAGCRLIILRRPDLPAADLRFENPALLIQALRALLPPVPS
jgi:precorrin-6A/cobalt-precorrin-6A reductase